MEKKIVYGARADSNFITALVRNTATEEKVAYCACASLYGWVSKTCCADNRQQECTCTNQASSTCDSNIIIYCDAAVQPIFIKFAGVVGIDNPHNII